MRETRYHGVYTEGRNLYTKSLVPGQVVYGERILVKGDEEYRQWNPRRSKMAAALKLRMKNYTLNNKSRVLYLGAATGTTVSHISDIARDGIIYAVEISHRAMRDLVSMARDRINVLPVLGNARTPAEYQHLVDPGVDVLYQDVAQRDQVGIFLKNAEMFLSSHGRGYLMLKTRSIDVSAKPESVLRAAKAEIETGGMEVIETLDISRYERDHFAMVIRWR